MLNKMPFFAKSSSLKNWNIQSEEEEREENSFTKSKKTFSREEEGKKEENWSNGEKILCFHGPLIYEAKIQNVSIFLWRKIF